MGTLDYKGYLETKGWQLRNADISQAKGDLTASEFRDSWNEKWKSINDIFCSVKYFEQQDRIVEKI